MLLFVATWERSQAEYAHDSQQKAMALAWFWLVDKLFTGAFFAVVPSRDCFPTVTRKAVF